MSGNIESGKVTNKALVAYYEHLAVAVPVVIDATAGANGDVLHAGQLLKRVSGKYLPMLPADSVVIGETKILSQSVTLTGEDLPNVSGFITGYFNKSALIGSVAQITALGVEHEAGVVFFKQS